jgi:type VI secretion system ImpM family protein
MLFGPDKATAGDSHRSAEALARITAIFGKLPGRPDFVRLGGHSLPPFERWLEQGLEATAARRGGLPAGPISFYLPGLLSGPPVSPCPGRDLVGVMVPSRDQVGRAFPLAWVRSCAGGGAARWHEVWQSENGFRARALALLTDAEPLGEAALTMALEQPIEALVEAAPVDPLQIPMGGALEACVGPTAEGCPAHALVTLIDACAAARAGTRTSPSITLEAPTRDAVTTGFWLALSGRLLGYPASRPALLLADDRLVLGLAPGVVAPGLLAALCLGIKAGPRHWSLLSADPAARARSVARLPAGVQGILENQANTFAALIDAIAGPAPVPAPPQVAADIRTDS